MDMRICVGFGFAQIWKNNQVFFDGEKSEETKLLAEFEAIAKDSPEAEWECYMESLFWSARWRRSGEGDWICVESEMGFA